MTEMSELTGAYQREVAPLGEFTTFYPSATADLQAAMLGDAFAEAQLDGFFHASVLDVDSMEVSPDLSSAGRALVVIYAGIRTLRNEIKNLKTKTMYKAGPVEYDVEQGASTLTELLKESEARKIALITAARIGAGTTVSMTDLYGQRMARGNLGWLPSELGTRT